MPHASVLSLIWNGDAGCYEEKNINKADLPMWNMDMSSLVACADIWGGIKLHPDWPGWKKVEMTVGRIVMDKYIRAAAETD